MSIKRLTALTLCLCMLLQNALALGLASHTMQHARGFVSDDIELICTGKTMRYISVSATELEGEFVFISPELLKAPVEHVDCTNGTLADLPHIERTRRCMGSDIACALSRLSVSPCSSTLHIFCLCGAARPRPTSRITTPKTHLTRMV